MKRKELVVNNWTQKKNYSLNITEKANRCTQQKKKKMESVPPLQICEGKNDTAKDIHFPEEIVMDILSRLPVRSLQRFKCVSPFWRSLISDHHFIMKHLNRATNDLNSQKLLTSKLPARRNNVVGFNSYSLSSPIQVIEDEQRLDGPPNCKPSHTIRCCGDGLVLLSSSNLQTDLTNFWLWNPSTRESIVLPSQEYILKFSVFGLGYDSASDDYKIVAADLHAGYFGNVSVQILPLKSGSWRKIGKCHTSVHGYLNCAMYSLDFIHGAFHWLGYNSPCYSVISFNISTEVYGEIPLIDWMYYKCKFMLDHGVSVLRGMLCYYSMPGQDGNTGTFKLWAMKEYGVKESWIQWLAIRDIDGIGSAIPHYMFADGDVLRHSYRLQPITSQYWTSKRGPFELWPEARQAIVYTESLISPKLLI